MDAQQLENGLRNFYGTENWYRYSRLFPRILLTDGVKFLAENAGGGGAYWLIDAIASHQPDCLKDEMLQGIQFWTLKVNSDKSAVLICERDSNDVFLKQDIEFTDFPMNEIKLYVEPMGDGNYCVLLPSEH